MKHFIRPRHATEFSAVAFAALLLLTAPLHADQTNFISALDISQVQQGWGTPHANLSVEGNPLSIGGQKFTNGLGTHADSQCILDLNGKGATFSAAVGVDDEVRKLGSVVFKVIGDGGKLLWTSTEMHGGDAAQEINVDVTGVKQLILEVSGGDDISFDHADWADAKIISPGKARIKMLPAIHEDAVILTPKSAPAPRINSARVFGVRPGAPFLYTIAATGDRPMTFAASGLPKGLQLDKQSGQITGALTDKGEYVVKLTAKNNHGKATRSLKIICGAQIGLTPALGWNSWNCFASAVSADKGESRRRCDGQQRPHQPRLDLHQH